MARVAIWGGEPTNSCTNKVTIGCTVRTLNCAMNKTKNSAIRLAEPSKIPSPENRDRDFAPPFGATKSSRTTNHTNPRPEKQAAEVI
jgi:hypothetical protein